jgi:DJ-1 family protein
MEKSALVPIAYGSEEMEAVIIIDLLRRADISVVVAGDNDIVTCSRGIKIVPDRPLSDIADDENFGAIVLPGGSKGVDGLIEDDNLIRLLKYNNGKGNLIGAICAAPKILVHHDIINEDTLITSFPDIYNELNHKNYSEESVVVDGNIITSRGAGTAIDFALKIIENLVSEKKAKEVAVEIVYNS